MSLQQIQLYKYSTDRFTCNLNFLVGSCWQLDYCKAYVFIISEREWKPIFIILGFFFNDC